ncbi:hypothetical protein GQ43DRAFT_444328 [Delitschia confertaspora ATCC 74209]|uniref:Uncharacterized protein n=1 Tax=Delitschia confertaspora ATCC 74209 TaxID=1513339 RepID=A0A9P4MNW1_9PLEO|nr:hypothetical protein GQ43DRAFT_444328 [Delitschia confertaspora ATCC 74209]
MPSFLRNRDSRSYSFPPCINSFDYSPELPDIDEDPFAHFLTPVTEEDDPYDGLSLSAGIIVTDGTRTSKASKFKSTVAQKWARYVQHNHSNLHGMYHAPSVPKIEEEDEDEESFMQLDDTRLLDTPYILSQLSGPPSPRSANEPTRGRAQELLSPQKRGRPRSSRTLSGRRHSWREPSPDIFTVMEAEEADIHVETKDGVQHRRSHVEVAERARL